MAVIGIVFADPGRTSAAVHYQPTWLQRIFGAVEHDFEASRFGCDWLHEVTGRCVSAEVQRALEHARAVLDTQR